MNEIPESKQQALNALLTNSAERIKKIRESLDACIIQLQKTETGYSVNWPAYVAQVDFIKDFMCVVAGYCDWDEAERAGKMDTIHDLACGFVDSVAKALL